MTIAHAFNYRMAVLRNGIKSAVRVARATKVEVCFLLNSDIQWGQQVEAMFQIIFMMVVELPSCLEELEELSGMPPNVQLKSEPCGHDNHEDMECECQSSDRTAAYIHDLSVNKWEPADSPDTDMALSTVQITFIFIDFRVCDFAFAFAFKTPNAHCVSRFIHILFSDRFQFAF